MIKANSIYVLQGMIDYLNEVPYDVTRRQLYDAYDLYEDFHPDIPSTLRTCYDGKVYEHFIRTGKNSRDVRESLARTVHDHGVHSALNEFFEQHDPYRCVGVMGGHALPRTTDQYRKIVLLSKRLTELGFVMLSGGGPGAMEATHLGAWLAGRTLDEVDDALLMLTPYPSFHDEGWLSSAFNVMERYPQQQKQYVSLGIPTWLYGHEPSTPFASHIAKFFDNSIREDAILTLPYGGIVYTPGSAGTMQEIFQDAVQNHYVSVGLTSPMIFVGCDFWTNQMPVYPMLQNLMQTGMYKNLILALTDDLDEVVQELQRFQDSLK